MANISVTNSLSTINNKYTFAKFTSLQDEIELAKSLLQEVVNFRNMLDYDSLTEDEINLIEEQQSFFIHEIRYNTDLIIDDIVLELC